MAIQAGDIIWTVDANVQKLDAAIQKSSKKLKALGAGLTVVGTAITGTMGASVKKFADFGDSVQKMAIRTGVSTEAISELGFVAEQSGASIETIGKAFKNQADFIEDARDGLSTSTDALDKLGLSLQDLEGQTPEQVFMTLSESIASIEDPMQRAALANDVFKRSGQELLPLFATGADGIKNLREEAQSLGVSMSQEQADAAAKLTDAWNSLKTSMAGVALQIGGALAPVLNNFLPKITGFVSRIIEWVQNNKTLASTITLVTAAFGGIALVVGPLLIALPAISAGFAAVSAALAAVSGPVLAVGLAIGGVLVAALMNLKPLMESARQWITENWERITQTFEIAKETLGAVMGAIGELMGAAMQVISGVLVGFASGTAESFAEVAGASGTGTNDFLGNLQGFMKGTTEFANILSKLFGELSSWLERNWDKIVSAADWAARNILGPMKLMIQTFKDVWNWVTWAVDGIINKINQLQAALANAGGAVAGALGFAQGGVVPGYAQGGMIQGLASGGLAQSRMVKVGERGPELLSLPVGTRVLSNNDMMRAVQQGAGMATAARDSGGGGVNVTLNINGAGETDPDKLLAKVKGPLSRWLADEYKKARR